MEGEPVRIECTGQVGGAAVPVKIFNAGSNVERTLAADERLVLQTLIIQRPITTTGSILLQDGSRLIWGT